MKAIKRLLYIIMSTLSSGFVNEEHSYPQLVFNYKTVYKWLLIQQKETTQHDQTNKMTCVPNDDADQPGHPPSLVRDLAVSLEKVWVFSYQ